MECDIDPVLFGEIGELLVDSWENPQIRLFIQSRGVRQEHIIEIQRILSQINEQTG